MNLEEIKLWHDALLDGTHVQGRANLEDEFGRECCLGVYMNLCGIEKELTEGAYTFASKTRSFITAEAKMKLGYGKYDEISFKIPLHLRGKADGCTVATPISLNDVFLFSFSEIAECIKFTFPEAFE